MHNPDVALTVPGAYAEDFRAAAAAELKEEAGYVLKERAKILEAKHCFGEDDKRTDDESLRMALRMLVTDAAVYQQVGSEGGGDIVIDLTDRHGCLAHVCETMARRILGPQLQTELDIGPMDRKEAERLHTLIAELTWAIDSAATVHASHFPNTDPEEAV